MAQKAPNPKFQIPGSLQIANSKVEATLVSWDLAIGISFELGIWDLGFPNF
jgi:hypothetical protein